MKDSIHYDDHFLDLIGDFIENIYKEKHGLGNAQDLCEQRIELSYDLQDYGVSLKDDIEGMIKRIIKNNNNIRLKNELVLYLKTFHLQAYNYFMDEHC